jgi:hypothetical protein
MENELLQLKARSRSSSQQEKTFKEIQRLVAKQKKREHLLVFSTYLSAAVLIFIFITTLLSIPSTTTTAASKEIKSVEYTFTEEPMPWYKFNRQLLNTDGVNYISELVMLAEKGNVLTDADLQGYFGQYEYVVLYKDGNYDIYKFLYSQERNIVYFVNKETWKGTYLTKEQFDANLKKIDPNFYEEHLILRFIGLLTLFSIYIYCVKRINPQFRTKLFYSPSFIKYCIKFLIFLFTLFFFYFATGIIGGLNALVALAVISIVSIFRAAAENHTGELHRSWKEVPITIIVYWIGFCIAFS